MDISTASSVHSEAAAILMDVSQQPQPDPIIYTNYCNKQDQTGISNQQEHTVYSNQSQAATILMNVGQGKDVPITKSTSDLMDVDEEIMKPDDQETTVIVAVDGGVQEMYSLSGELRSAIETGKPDVTQQMCSLTQPAPSTTISPQANQQFKVMSSDGKYHTITLTGVEEKITEGGDVQTSSIIQVDTPGRETETITVSGLADNYNLESLAQIAEIVVNSADRGNSIVSLTDDKSLPPSDATSYTDFDQESQYIAMKDLDPNKIVDVQTEESGDRNVLQTITVDPTQGSQNLVSLAQIAELVINQGCLEVGDGSNPTELQIGSDSNNQPIVISGLDSSIGEMQTVTSSSRKTSQIHQTRKTEYITVPIKKSQQQSTTKYVALPRESQMQSSYTTTILPDSRRKPAQKSSAGRNIYSKIKSDNGECYMVVLPESDPLNPAQLRNLLSSMNETKSTKAKTDPTDQKDKPQMFSAGSQTTRGFNPLPKTTYTGTRHESIPGTSIVIVAPATATETRTEEIASELLNSNSDEGPVIITEGTITTFGTDRGSQVGVEGSLTEDFVQTKIATEKIDEDEAQTDSQEAVDDNGENFDNCGHEVAEKKVHSDQPLPESITTSVQTDVTANCYLNVSPDELGIHKKKIARHSYVNKRIYLDDPKPSKDTPDSYEVTVSPFLSRKSLIDRENAYFICGTCAARYTTAEELKIHSKAHKAKQALCPTCKKKCANIKILADHVISHTRCKTFKCSVCTTETIFTTAEDFKEHVKEHLHERYFICGSCNQKFIHIANLKVHMRVHTGEKPFECKLCDADFSQKASLDAHVSSFHKNEKPFQCDQCGVSFARKTDLRIHTRKHTGERPYSCDVCDKTFTSNSGLTSHKKTHFRKRFHQCFDCEKSFDTPARLKKHVENWHSGERALKCRVCDREFETREDVRSHMKTHSLEPFPCVSCNFGTHSKEILTNHIKEKHPKLVDKMPELFYGVDP